MELTKRVEWLCMSIYPSRWARLEVVKVWLDSTSAFLDQFSEQTSKVVVMGNIEYLLNIFYCKKKMLLVVASWNHNPYRGSKILLCLMFE